MLVGLRFRPGAGGGGLGVPLDELRDLRVDAADVDRAFDLDGELAPAEVAAGGSCAVAAERGGDPLVQRVAAGLERGERVDAGLSARQLRRRFHAAVGYGPKTLERVLRFRRAVDAIDGGRTDLAGIAFDAGYADQAHLTRECTRLAGLPPAQLMRARGAPPTRRRKRRAPDPMIPSSPARGESSVSAKNGRIGRAATMRSGTSDSIALTTAAATFSGGEVPSVGGARQAGLGHPRVHALARDEPRRDRREAHARPAVLDAQRARQLDDAGLRRSRRREERRRALAGDRREVDDVARPALEHPRHDERG